MLSDDAGVELDLKGGGRMPNAECQMPIVGADHTVPRFQFGIWHSAFGNFFSNSLASPRNPDKVLT
jgi:hypothetical protein